MSIFDSAVNGLSLSETWKSLGAIIASYIYIYNCIYDTRLKGWLNEARWHIYASVNYAIIGSDNGLSPGWHQAIIWASERILLNGLLGTNLNKILIEMYTL